MVNLGLRTDPEAAERRQRGTPALDGMLQQEAADNQRQQGEPPVYQQGQPRPDAGDGGGVGLQRSLDVPLSVQFCQPAIDGLRPGGGAAGDALLVRRRISSLTWVAVLLGTRCVVRGIMGFPCVRVGSRADFPPSYSTVGANHVPETSDGTRRPNQPIQFLARRRGVKQANAPAPPRRTAGSAARSRTIE